MYMYIYIYVYMYRAHVKLIDPLAMTLVGNSPFSSMKCALANYSNCPCHFSTWNIQTFSGHMWDHHFQKQMILRC